MGSRVFSSGWSYQSTLLAVFVFIAGYWQGMGLEVIRGLQWCRSLDFWNSTFPEFKTRERSVPVLSSCLPLNLSLLSYEHLLKMFKLWQATVYFFVGVCEFDSLSSSAAKRSLISIDKPTPIRARATPWSVSALLDTFLESSWCCFQVKCIEARRDNAF